MALLENAAAGEFLELCVAVSVPNMDVPVLFKH